MSERREDKSHDYGRGICDLEKLTWNGLFNGFLILDTFTFQGRPRFSWNNGQLGRARRLARLNRFYTPKQSRLSINHLAYFIHGYSVGSDHVLVQLEICIGKESVRKSAYKWNLSYLHKKMNDILGQRCRYVGMDYHAMILKGIEDGALNEGITKRLITFIPKEGDKAD